MNLIKFPKVTSDLVVVDTAIILDASKLVECTSTGATCVATFAAGSANSILTFTFDGATTAAKLQLCKLLSLTLVQRLLDQLVTQKECLISFLKLALQL